MTQYQKELAEVRKNNGDVKAFEKEWHHRACDCYRENVKSESDIHKFRSGEFVVQV